MFIRQRCKRKWRDLLGAVFFIALTSLTTEKLSCTWHCPYQADLGRVSLWTLLEVFPCLGEVMITCSWLWAGSVRCVCSFLARRLSLCRKQLNCSLLMCGYTLDFWVSDQDKRFLGSFGHYIGKGGTPSWGIPLCFIPQTNDKLKLSTGCWYNC